MGDESIDGAHRTGFEIDEARPARSAPNAIPPPTRGAVFSDSTFSLGGPPTRDSVRRFPAASALAHASRSRPGIRGSTSDRDGREDRVAAGRGADLSAAQDGGRVRKRRWSPVVGDLGTVLPVHTPEVTSSLRSPVTKRADRRGRRHAGVARSNAERSRSATDADWR